MTFYVANDFIDNEGAGAHTTILSIQSSGLPGGTGSAPAGIDIPLTFNFVLSAEPLAALTDYSMTFDILTGGVSIFGNTIPTFSARLTGMSQLVTGGGTAKTITPIASTETYTVKAVLTVDWLSRGTAALDIHAPPGAFDFNSVNAAVVDLPEPASVILMSPGILAGFAALRIRKIRRP